MKAVVVTADHQIAVADVPDPTLSSPDDAIVRVTLAGICGTDLRSDATRTPGGRPGHEFIGEVVAVGPEVTDVRVGDQVLGSPLVGCGRCPPCRSSDPYRCHSGFRIVGDSADLPGAQAEYLLVPAANHSLRPQGSLSDASALLLTDSLATGWAAATAGGVGPDKTVMVIGLGPVGLCAIKCCRLLGAERVLALDPDPVRRSVAAALGAEAIPPSDTIVDEVLARTSGRGAELTIEAVGNADTLAMALGCVARLGTIVSVGLITSASVALPLRRLGARSLTLRGLVCASSSVWPDLVPLVGSGALDVDDLVTHEYRLSDASTAYQAARDHTNGELKVALRP